MTIVSVEFEPNFLGNGLNHVKLDGLSDLVLIAGRNGSGKSRLINSIYDALREGPATLPTDAVKLKFLANTKLTPINILPNQVKLGDETDYTLRAMAASAQSARSLNVTDFHTHCCALVREIQNKWIESTHPSTTIPESDRAKYTEEYNRLNELITELMGEPLDRDALQNPTIFGMPLAQARLSAGQTVLLQVAVRLFTQSEGMKDLVLLMDEPENHLHPDACVSVIEKIRAASKGCQIWIATHSVSVLSYFDSATLLFANAGSIQKSGREPEMVMQSLIGNDVRVGRLRGFMALPHQLAMARYAAECLVGPTVAGAGEHDPQTDQVYEQLAALRLQRAGKAIRLLDFGAGRGRVLENLLSEAPSFQKEIEYFAYDPDPTNREQCEKIIEAAYGNRTDRYFENLGDVLAEGLIYPIDVVLMCNVLHEIEPKEWVWLFSDPSGGLSHAVDDEGSFLIVEDQEIPVGEKPHNGGFIVLDEPELRILFSLSENEKIISSSRRNGRLKAHLIPKRWASRVTNTSIKAALLEKKNTSVTKILSIRDQILQGEDTFKIGLKHAFWVQQLANTTLSLSEDF